MRYADTTVGGELRFLPETLRIDGQVATQVRHRGIYQARLYRSQMQLTVSRPFPAEHRSLPRGNGAAAHPDEARELVRPGECRARRARSQRSSMTTSST